MDHAFRISLLPGQPAADYRLGTCTGIRYEQGEYSKEPGYKGGRAETIYKDGYCLTTNGYGWGTRIKPSKLILKAEINGCAEETWIDKYFKDYIGKLTRGLRDAISATMPACMLFEEKRKLDGSLYYIVPDCELGIWAADTIYYLRTLKIRHTLDTTFQEAEKEYRKAVNADGKEQTAEEPEEPAEELEEPAEELE